MEFQSRKKSQEIIFLIGLMPIITMLLFFIVTAVWSAGPMMDGYTLDVSQSGAVNSIRDGKFSAAILNEEKALKIDEELKGPLHPSLVSLYDNLGTLYRYVAVSYTHLTLPTIYS